MATAPAIPADDLFPVEQPCPRCDQLPCDCPRDESLLGALAAQPQPAEPAEGGVGEPPNLALYAQILASPAIGAFLGVRLEQAVKHGHTPEADREGPLFWIPREAQKRLVIVMDEVGRDQGGPPRSARHQQRRAHALRCIDVAGALLLAARDQLAHAVEQGKGTQFAPEAESGA